MLELGSVQAMTRRLLWACSCSGVQGGKVHSGNALIQESVAEGHDKPAKYPKRFRTVDVVVLNKVDLLPHVDFDVDAFRPYVDGLNPNVRVIHTSCRTGEGIEEWVAWLKEVSVEIPAQSTC